MPGPSPAPADRETFTPFHIAMVCQGNICRSPLAEVLMRTRLGEAGLHRAVTVASGGLGAVVGSPMDATAAEMARRYRGRPDEFRARQLRSAIVNPADLLLTMTRPQRDEVVQRYPRALQRTFTLTEFSKLLAATSTVDLPETDHAAPGDTAAGDIATPGDTAAPDDRVVESLSARSGEIAALLRERTRRFSSLRSTARLVPADDIQDPFRQSVAVHEAVAQKISLSTSQIVHNFIGWAIDTEGIDRVRA